MPVVFIISNRESHIGSLASISVERESGFVAIVFEGGVPVVHVEIIRRGIIGDQDVWFAVIIHVCKKRIETLVAVGAVYAELLAHVGEGTVAVAVEQMIVCSLKSARAAHHLHAAVLTKIVTAGL